MSRCTVPVALALALTLAVPAHADPMLGLGLTITFGHGSEMQTGLGARVFSDDEEESAVAMIGLDYLFQAKTWRPSLGAAYLNDNTYLGLDLGYRLGGGGIDFGLSGGGVNTADPAPASPGGGGGGGGVALSALAQ